MSTTTEKEEAQSAFPESGVERRADESTSVGVSFNYIDLSSIRTATTAPVVAHRSNARKPSSGSKLQKRVLRRLRGVLLREEGKEAHVLLVDGKAHYHYRLPLQHLQQAGIKHMNQPFEMDEIETSDGDSVFIGYAFRQTAGAASAFLDVVELSPELKEKQKSIFRRFEKTSV
jgi:hypothetical protein